MSDTIIVQINRADAEWLRDYRANLPRAWTAEDARIRAHLDKAIIAALPPAEPTKRGAVVEAGGVLHWSDERRRWRTFGGIERDWASLCKMGTPVIHFEGVVQ